MSTLRRTWPSVPMTEYCTCPTPSSRTARAYHRCWGRGAVGGVATRKGAVEIAWSRPSRALVGYRMAAARPRRLRNAARVADDVGVGGQVEGGVHRSTPRLLAERRSHVGRADVPVPVPLGLAVGEPQAVQSCRRRGTSGRSGIRLVDRVRTDPQISAVEVVGKLSGHVEVDSCRLGAGSVRGFPRGTGFLMSPPQLR